MVSLLRKIRKSLLNSGSGRKYLLYAFGEIFLVVVGILIALQVNNWNVEKTNKRAAKVFLRNLVESVQDDTQAYVKLEEGSRFRYYSSQYLLRMANVPLHDLQVNDTTIYPWRGNSIWENPIPNEYDKEFIRLSFLYVDRIDLKVETPNEIEKLRNSTEYSFLENEDLKDAIDGYYSDWVFRVGPSADLTYRRIIWSFQDALMDHGIVISLPFANGDPIELLESNPALVGRLRGIAVEASWQALSARIIIEKGEKLSKFINDEILKM